MFMSRTVAQPVAHNERAGMFMKVVLKAVPGVRCVVCWCVVLCCVVSGLFRGTFLEQLFEPFDGGNVKPTLTWNGKRAYMFNVICSLLHVFLFVCVRVLGAFLCVRAWRTGLRSGRICWQKCSLNFSRFLVCSFLFFCCLSLLFRFISCSRSLCALWFASSPSSRSSAFSAGGRDGGPARVFATSSRLRTSGSRAGSPYVCNIWSRWIS